MKGDKKILAVAILLLLISVGFTTYAIYKSETSATGEVKLSGWSVVVDGNDITTSPATTTLTFDLSDCGTGSVRNGQNDTFAPGDTCDIVVPVVLTGSEVDVLLEAALGTTTPNPLPTGLTVALKSGDDSKVINYAATMETDVTIEVRWTTNTTTQNSSDVAARGTTVSIPLTLTASQNAWQ